MASDSTPEEEMASSSAAHKHRTPSAAHDPHDKLRVERLQELLATISQRVGRISKHSPPLEGLEDGAPRDQNMTIESSLSPTDTILHTTPAVASPPVMELLGSALNKTATLFAIEPPRSPRAESQMSYSLNVNAKYRAHMDDAPARAADLEKDLRGIKTAVEGVVLLVEKCEAIIGELATERHGVITMQASVVDAQDDHFTARGVTVTGQSKAEDGLTLEERMGRANVKSRSFV